MREKINVILACIIVEAYLLYGVMSGVCLQTWPELEKIGVYILYSVYVLVFLKVILQRKNVLEGIIILGLLGLAELSRRTTQTYAVWWFVSGILIAQDLCLKKVLKVDLLFRIGLAAMLLLLPLIGLYPCNLNKMIGGRSRSFFGWYHPNEMGLFFLMLCILWIYFRYEYWNWKDTLGIMSVLIFLDIFPNSRTPEICILFGVGLIGLSMWLRNKATKRIICLVLAILAMAALIIGVVGTIGLITLKENATGLVTFLPETVQSRVIIGHTCWLEQGFSFIGQRIVYAEDVYIDMMYAYLGLHMGILILLFVIGLNVSAIVGAYREKNEKILIILFIFSCYSLMEHEHFKMLSGFYPLILGYYMWSTIRNILYRFRRERNNG